MKPRKPTYHATKRSKVASGDELPAKEWEILVAVPHGHRVERRPPSTATQAIMEAAPHETPEVSVDEAQARQSRALAALNLLDEFDQELVRLIVFERMSYRDIADARPDIPNHVWAHRRWQSIRSELAELLGPEFQELLTTNGDE